MSVATIALSKVMRLPTLLRRDAMSYAIFALTLVLVASPIAFLVLGSFSSAKIPGDLVFSGLSFSNYRAVWADPSLPQILYNTLFYAVGATTIGVVVAIALAWLVERTDIRCKTLIYAAVPLTLAMPGLLQAMAWVLLMSPRIGFVNQALREGAGFQEPVFNIYSMQAMILIEGLRLVPTAFLMLVPLMRSMDPMLEEAASTCGANAISALRKVTLRLMLPGVLAITIYQFITAIEAFEIPGIIGMPAGVLVFSTKIYLLLIQTSSLPVYGQANALAMLYLVIALVGMYFYGRAVSHSERYSIITGKGYRPQLIRLGRWRYLATVLTWAYIVVAVIMPVTVLAYVSFLPTLRLPSMATFGVFTLDNYREILESPFIATIVTNTVIMSVVTATATAVLSFAIAMVVVRSRFWGRRVLDQLAFAPSAIPGMVLALAFLWVFLQVDKAVPGVFGTIWSIAIAFTVAFLPYGTRTMNAAILQVHRDLEEAAYASGSRQWRVMQRIFFPLMVPALIGVWVWTILHAARIIGIPLLLYEGTKNQVLAVLMWNMWEQGQLPAVAAIGTLLTMVLLAITLGMRIIGFGRNLDKS